MAQGPIVTVVTQPTVEPITLDQAKAQVRRPSSYTAEDDYLTFLISVARTVIEKKTGRAFHQQQLRYTLDFWPSEPVIELPRATPLITVDSIVYRDYNGAETTWPADQYDVDLEGRPGRISPIAGNYWPVVLLAHIAAVKIEYTAGIPDNQSPAVYLEAPLRHAVMMMLGHLYQNRETVSIGTLMQGQEMPWSVMELISDFTLREF